MASAVHYQLYPKIRSFVPTVIAPKLACRCGKREGREELVSKHQLQSGNGRWAGQRGVGGLNLGCETKIQGNNGVRERGRGYEVAERRKLLACKRRRRGRAEETEKSSTCVQTGDHSCHTQRAKDCSQWDARSWTDARCFECVRSTEVRRHRSLGHPPQWTLSLHIGWPPGVLQR